MEVLAHPAGGASCCSSSSAAWSRPALPVIVGGLTIVGALGILRLIALSSSPVHFFAQPVVTLIGLGIAIDYGLFMVSRFREEIAEGYDTETAVRRTVMTAGRTVMFSAVIIVASLAGLLLFPQGFLKSLTYAGHRVGDAVGDPVDHRAARGTGHPRAATSTRSVCARCTESRSCATSSSPAASSTGSPTGPQKTQDPRGGRERLLGHADQPGDEAAGAVSPRRSSSS